MDETLEAFARAGTTASTFCRGVGPVHWHYEDALGNGYDAILTSKNF